MSKALLADLRERVVAAVAAGASCRAAALRFGVSASSAIRWCVQSRKVGTVAPSPIDGDRRSARIEAHAPLILGSLSRARTSRWPRSRRSWPGPACQRASRQSGGSSTGTGSRAKKDGTRGRAGPSRHPEAALVLVREPARPRSRPPGVH